MSSRRRKPKNNKRWFGLIIIITLIIMSRMGFDLNKRTKRYKEDIKEAEEKKESLVLEIEEMEKDLENPNSQEFFRKYANKYGFVETNLSPTAIIYPEENIEKKEMEDKKSEEIELDKDE